MFTILTPHPARPFLPAGDARARRRVVAMNSSSVSGAARPIGAKHMAQPVYLLDVSAGAGRRTEVHGALWDGVLNATPDDDIDRPSPIEALLAAVAACFVRNLHSTAESAHVVFDRVELHVAAELHVDAERSDDPPAITVVRLDAELSTSAPFKTASRVVALALRYGTITRTVARASQFEFRASINGTPLEVPDVH
jgi:uncharacterized OsmC-like protein